MVADLRSNGGLFTPRSNWTTLDYDVKPDEDGRKWLNVAYSPASIASRMSTMSKMLDPWIGSHQMGRVNLGAIERYRPWLANSDPLGLWRDNVEDSEVAARLLVADLGSILDLDLIWSFLPN